MSKERPYQSFITKLIQQVGGKENITDVTHCITRLRFRLENDSFAKDVEVKKNSEVIDLVKKNGQYQVVIGTEVKDVYEELMEQLEIIDKSDTRDGEIKETNKKGVFNTVLQTITGSISPIIGVLAASGILKGIVAALVGFQLISETSFLFILLSAIGDAVFYFLPIILGFTTARRMNSDSIVGAVLGAVLIYPSIVQIATNEGIAEIFGLSINIQTYTSTVFPVIVAVFLSSHIEAILKNYLPNYLKMIFVPLFSMVIVSTIMLLLVGPIINWVSGLLSSFINGLYTISPTLFGAVVGGTSQLLVVFGLHWGLLPIAINDLTQNGFSYFIAINSGTMIAQGAVALAVFMKTKKVQTKELSLAATISAFCGITEPAVYGITLKSKRILWISSLCSALGGALGGLLKLKAFGFAGSLIGFSSFINPKTGIDHNFYAYWVVSIFTLIITFICTYFIALKEDVVETI